MARITKPNLLTSSAAKRHLVVNWTTRRQGKELNLYLTTPTSNSLLSNIRILLNYKDISPAAKGYHRKRPTRAATMTKIELTRSIARRQRKSVDSESSDMSSQRRARQSTSARGALRCGDVRMLIQRTDRKDGWAREHVVRLATVPESPGLLVPSLEGVSASHEWEDGLLVPSLEDPPPIRRQRDERPHPTPRSQPRTATLKVHQGDWRTPTYEELNLFIPPPEASQKESETQAVAATIEEESGSGSGPGPRSGSSNTEATETRHSRKRTSSFLDRFAGLLGGNTCAGTTASCATVRRPSSRTSVFSGLSSSFSSKIQSPPRSSSRKEVKTAFSETCCSNVSMGGPRCAHRRLQALICGSRKTYQSIDLTAEECRQRDQLENTLLHLAARWQAPLILLDSLVRQGVDATKVNGSGETFLHVYRPHADGAMGIGGVFRFMNTLQTHSFDFSARDSCGQTFLQEWIQASEMTFAVMELFLAALPRTLLLALLREPTAGGSNVVAWIETRLAEQGRDTDVERYLEDLTWKYARFRSSRALHGTFRDPTYYSPPRLAGWTGLHELMAGVYHWETSYHRETYHPPSFTRERRDKYMEYFEMQLAAHWQEADYINKQDGNGRTPLMVLLRSWQDATVASEFLQQLVTALCEAGAWLDSRDGRGNTAVHYATRKQLVDVVSVLCRYGAHVNVRDWNGMTPMHLVKAFIKDEGRQPRPPGRSAGMDGISRMLACGVVLTTNGATDIDHPGWKDLLQWGESLGVSIQGKKG